RFAYAPCRSWPARRRRENTRPLAEWRHRRGDPRTRGRRRGREGRCPMSEPLRNYRVALADSGPYAVCITPQSPRAACVLAASVLTASCADPSWPEGGIRRVVILDEHDVIA